MLVCFATRAYKHNECMGNLLWPKLMKPTPTIIMWKEPKNIRQWCICITEGTQAHNTSWKESERMGKLRALQCASESHKKLPSKQNAKLFTTDNFHSRHKTQLNPKTWSRTGFWISKTRKTTTTKMMNEMQLESMILECPSIAVDVSRSNAISHLIIFCCVCLCVWPHLPTSKW